MIRFRIRITVRSTLHELVRISESSHVSVFELLVYRVHNEHEPGSSVIGLDRTSESVCCN